MSRIANVIARVGSATSVLVAGPARAQARPVVVGEIPPRGSLFTGRRALITGVGPTIGRAIASAVAREGATVDAVDRDDAAVDATVATIETDGGRARGQVFDVRDAQRVARCVADGPPVDLLFCNAGIGQERRHLEDDQAFWQEIYDVNVRGALTVARAVIHRLKAEDRPGSVVFTSSVNAHATSPVPAYAGSKAILERVMRDVAAGTAQHGIRVNGIAPGYTALDADGGAVPSGILPLSRTSVHPFAVANAAVFLASDQWSPFTTGALLVVDGGQSLTNSHTHEDTERD